MASSWQAALHLSPFRQNLAKTSRLFSLSKDVPLGLHKSELGTSFCFLFAAVFLLRKTQSQRGSCRITGFNFPYIYTHTHTTGGIPDVKGHNTFDAHVQMWRCTWRLRWAGCRWSNLPCLDLLEWWGVIIKQAVTSLDWINVYMLTGRRTDPESVPWSRTQTGNQSTWSHVENMQTPHRQNEGEPCTASFRLWSYRTI